MRRFPLLTTGLLLILAGCATPKMSGTSDTMSLPDAPKVPAREVRQEPERRAELPAPKEVAKFSLSVRDADVRDVFLLLSKDSGLNIIADKDVAGKISIDFSNLDINSALFAITRQLGLTFWPDKGFIRVSKPALTTHTFRVNYISGKRQSTSTTSAAITAGDNANGIGATRSTNITISGGTSGGETGSNSSSSSANQGSVTVTTSGASDFWKEIRKGLEVIIFGDTKGSGDADGGFSRGDEKTGKKLVISELAGIVMVSDYSDNIERIGNFIEDVEQSVRKQVMIQAHIVEVTLNDGYSFGIDWESLIGGSHKAKNGALFTLGQNLRPSPLTNVFTLDIVVDRFNLFLDAMKEQGQVSVLSSPKISTMNNQKAVIKLTTKEVSWVTNSFLNADGTILLSYTTPQVDEVGLFLDVTPQVDDDGTITMQIHPSISEKVSDSVSPDGKSTKPIIDTREVDTVITTKNGQTIVIAGLITDKINDTTKRVPFLGEIPVVGTLFTRTVQEKKKAELVVLLTPYVLTTKSIEDIRQSHEERLRKAGRVFESVPAMPSPVN